MQFHPKMPTEWVTKYKALSNQNLTFIETDNVVPLLKVADVMLCDTSSVTFNVFSTTKTRGHLLHKSPSSPYLMLPEPMK